MMLISEAMSPHRRRLLPALLGAALLWASATTARPVRAEDGEWALSLGPAFRGLVETPPEGDAAFRAGLSGFVRLRHGLGDFFQLGLALDLGVTLPNDTFTLGPGGALFAEAHYVIDIVTWVPFVTAGVGVLVRDGAPDDPAAAPVADLVVALGAGLEYRPARDWALGLTARYELVVTDLEHTDAFSLALVYTIFFE